MVDRFVLPLSSADVTYIGRPAGKNREVSEYRLVEILSQHFTRVTEKKNTKISVMVASVLAWFQTDHLHKVSVGHYRYFNLLPSSQLLT